MKRIKKLEIPRLPKKTLLFVVIAFLVGIVVSGFILGLAFYRGGFLYREALPLAPTPAPTPLPGEVEKAPTELETVGRMVIYTANLGLEVGDVDAAINEIRRITEDVGGFVSGVSTSKRDEQKVGIITVRVPQTDFYAIIWQIEGLGEVESKEVRGEDITEQYIDLKARLNNLQRQEQRLLEILAIATTVDEVLRVESELSRVRGEIERLTGQIQYIEHRVDLATITISLTEAAPKPWIETPKVDWGAPIEAGLWGMILVIQGLITLVIIAAPFMAIGVPTYYIYKRRKRTKSQASPEK